MENFSSSDFFLTGLGLVLLFFFLFIILPDYLVRNEEKILRESRKQAGIVKNMLLFPFVKMMELSDIWDKFQEWF